MLKAEEMQPSFDGSHTFEVTLGANQREQFFIVQDNDRTNGKIYPAFERSWKDMPCIGPHKGPATLQFWCINGAPNDDIPADDAGEPGDKYLVSFRWDNVKKVSWEKLQTRVEDYQDDGKYYVSGSWTCWDMLEMTADTRNKGKYQFDVQKTKLGTLFQISRNKDKLQLIYPNIDSGVGNAMSPVAPLDEYGQNKYWDIAGSDGDVFRVTLYRDPEDLSDISIEWEKIDSRPVTDVRDRYFLIGTPNNFGADGNMHELFWSETSKAYVAEVEIYAIPTRFQILENKISDRVIHPDKPECSQIQAHEVKGPDSEGQDRYWHIGKSTADKARVGDKFIVSFATEPKRVVTWKKEG